MVLQSALEKALQLILSADKELCNILEGMDIEVIDHIISVSTEKFVSMADSGLMPN